MGTTVLLERCIVRTVNTSTLCIETAYWSQALSPFDFLHCFGLFFLWVHLAFCFSYLYMEPRWDVIAISAMDNHQKAAFEKQLDQILDIAGHFRVYSDEPEGVKIGGGGATLSIVHRLYSEFGSNLFDLRILLIHAGGYSQRQPNASVLGKLFISTPVKNSSTGRPLTLFELKLRTYDPLLRRMHPGVFLAASDTVEYLGDLKRLNSDTETWALDGAGFVALAHPSSLEVGRQHGVYVLDSEGEVDVSKREVYEAVCRRVLQKPSIDLMKREGAILSQKGKGNQDVVYTDSAYYMSTPVVKKLLEIYEHLSPLCCELDTYGDFLQPLGTEATDDYLREKAINALVQSEELATARRCLFDSFRSFPLKVLLFTKSRFYHLGTFGELLNYFCQECEFREDFSAETALYSSIPGQKPHVQSSACVIYSQINNHFICGDSSELLLEYCRFPAGFEFTIASGQSILSNCSSGKVSSVVIPASVFMMTSPVDESGTIKHVTVVFGIKDDLKATIERESDIKSDQRRFNFSALLFVDNAQNRDVFDNQRLLWYARLFPGFDGMQNSFDWSLKWLNSVIEGKELDNEAMSAVEEARFYSMHDLVTHKNVDALLSYRSILQEEIRASLMQKGKL